MKGIEPSASRSRTVRSASLSYTPKEDMHYNHEVTLKGTNHVVSMSRYTRGSHPVTGRTCFGWKLKCSSCNFEMRCNEQKREARRHAMDHLKSQRGGT